MIVEERVRTDPDAAVVVALIRHERDLLDRGDLSHWMELFCDDGVYWMPSHPEQTDPAGAISLLLEDRPLMRIRAGNFQHPLSPAMAHSIRSTRLMELTQIERCADNGCHWRVVANFHAVVSYREQQQIFAGRYTYLIREEGKNKLIWRKRVDIINVDHALKSIVTYI